MLVIFRWIRNQAHPLLFVLLLFSAVTQIVRYHFYQHSIYFNTSNSVAANLLGRIEAVRTYHQLGDVNEVLSRENARLQNELFRLRAQKNVPGDLPYFVSKAVANQFQLCPAKLIVQSIQSSQNYLTIDKGYLDGIKPGMAVISSQGIVGKVISCTANLSMIISVLNTTNAVSAKIKTNGELGYVKWMAWQPEVVDMMDVSKYKKVAKGDTIVTSDLNSVFPPNIPIGLVAKLGTREDGNFHDIKVMLFTKFANLKYVYVVKNNLANQQKQLESKIPKVD